MFTPSDRTALMDDLKRFTSTLNRVQALVLVGSGSSGFRDRYSDLDLLVVVKNSEDVEPINQQLSEYLQSTFSILKVKTYRHKEDIFVTCFFFDHYLELDLGVWSFEQLRATKPNWIVLFDKDNTVSNKLASTLNHESQPSADEVKEQSLSLIWQFVRGAAVAIKRGQFIKAVKDLDYIRDHIIQILCLQNQMSYDFDRAIDLLDNNYTTKLR
ncbi:nucleotidyltransferase domain-containing protein [Alkalicoccobacillus porphyridii]|uniref:Polymerase nucleotidyl transferase domain-containing protein n=1 Tax=Alkalicoccobacillus porphyridii TaxID=2597270 RepID=A0A553ZWU5_9BACI|nr:nucleotidyltransferase domain-containing protein [Alkalicoccobacillus porphyridii]TSB45937.1 hypothetical protein FN960_13585 [Alkalicoccobacillus porphyridii]